MMTYVNGSVDTYKRRCKDIQYTCVIGSVDQQRHSSFIDKATRNPKTDGLNMWICSVHSKFAQCFLIIHFGSRKKKAGEIGSETLLHV